MQRICFIGNAGSGKAQPLYSKVLTPTGWATIGSLAVGDKVITPKGSESRIIGVFPQGFKDIYEVSFQDGRKTRSCAEHLWKVHFNVNRWGKKGSNRPEWEVSSLKQIKAKFDFASNKKRIFIPLVEPSPQPIAEESSFSLHPYVLGVLLGDGCFSNNFGLTTPDIEIVERCNKLLEAFQCELRKKQSNQSGIEYSLVKTGNQNNKENPVKTLINEMGLLGTKSDSKFIPKEYLNASFSDRIHLLQGLMDTDGTIGDKAGASFTSTSKELAESVQQLIWSIGGQAKLSSKVGTYKNSSGELVSCKMAFTVLIRHSDPTLLFFLSRKKNRISSYQYSNLRLRLENIEFIGKEEAVCIMIDDPEHLYVTDDYIVTHNTTLTADVFVALKKQHKNAELVPEFIRSDIQKNGPMRSTWEQYRTRSKQKELEDCIPETVDYLLTDSGILTPYFYACLYSEKSDPRSRIVLNDMHEYLLQDIYKRRYSHIFYLPMAETYAKNPKILEDGTRYQSKDEIEALEAHFSLVFTKHHKLDNIHVLDCPLDERVNTVLDIITTK